MSQITNLQELRRANKAYHESKKAQLVAPQEEPAPNETPAKQPKRRKRMVVEEAEPGFEPAPKEEPVDKYEAFEEGPLCVSPEEPKGE